MKLTTHLHLVRRFKTELSRKPTPLVRLNGIDDAAAATFESLLRFESNESRNQVCVLRHGTAGKYNLYKILKLQALRRSEYLPCARSEGAVDAARNETANLRT